MLFTNPFTNNHQTNSTEQSEPTGVKKHISKNQFPICIAVMAAGLLLMSLGISVFYYAELGSDPLSTFCEGIHVLTGLNHGTAFYICNGIIVFFLLFFGRQYIGVSTVVHFLSIGSLVDLYLSFYRKSGMLDGFHPLFLALIGLSAFTLGVALYISPGLGGGVLECLLAYLVDRTKWPYYRIRTLSDCLLVLCGGLLGASVGIGTIFSVLLSGVLIQFFRDTARKLFFQPKAEDSAKLF